MSRWRALAAIITIVVLGYVGYRLVHRALAPVVPAIVARDADAHRLLSGSVGGRLDRFLHDRPPPLAARAGNPRLVALTFDDGPYPVETPLLLDVLGELHVTATFFLIGDDAERFPGLVRRIARGGYEIANHTQTHPPNFEALDAAQVTDELERGARTLRRYASDPGITTMMRPPHGRFTEDTVRAAQRAGYDVILWHDDPGDWRPLAPQAIAEHMEASASAPDIVLLHSGRLGTVQALPAVVARFRAAGFSFVTVGQLKARVPLGQILHPAKFRV